MRLSLASAGGPPPYSPPGSPINPSYYAPPPPPPKRGLSPWAWVGIGCLTLTLLSFGGCVAFGLFAANRFQQAMKQPVNERDVVASLGGVPVYPGSKLDVETTKAIRATFGLVGGVSGGRVRFDAGVFSAPAPPDKVIAWYDNKLKAGGWKSLPKPPSGFNSSQANISEQRQYGKGNKQFVVQVGSGQGRRGAASNKEGSGAGGASRTTGSLLILTHVTGVPGES